MFVEQPLALPGSANYSPNVLPLRGEYVLPYVGGEYISANNPSWSLISFSSTMRDSLLEQGCLDLHKNYHRFLLSISQNPTEIPEGPTNIFISGQFPPFFRRSICMIARVWKRYEIVRTSLLSWSPYGWPKTYLC